MGVHEVYLRGSRLPLIHTLSNQFEVDEDRIVLVVLVTGEHVSGLVSLTNLLGGKCSLVDSFPVRDAIVIPGGPELVALLQVHSKGLAVQIFSLDSL